MNEEPEGGTGKWFATRTDDQLHDILRKVSAADPASRIAFEVLERRNAARSEARQLRWIKLTFWTTLILGAAGIAVAVLK
jgi:anti-sigma-K factor RskA